MPALLRALVLVLWSVLAPGLERSGDARAIAAAAVDAVLEDGGGPPVFGSHVEDLAVMAYFAARESSLQAGAVGDGGLAVGPWQLHGAAGRAPLHDQARTWLHLLHEGAARCPSSPAAIAWGGCDVDLRPYGTRATSAQMGRKRVVRARALLVEALARVTAEGVAERQR